MFNTEDFKKSVLDRAMRGKLTKQLPEDGDAKDLLNQIDAEKKALIKDKKIKAQKLLTEITEDEIPFEIPDNWQWIRLGEISNIINGDRGKNYPGKRYWIESGVPFINTGSISNDGYIDNNSLNYISEERFELLRSGFIQTGDIIYTLRGSVGKSGLNNIINRGAIASSLAIIRLMDINRNFINYLLHSTLNNIFINKFKNGSVQGNLSAKNLGNFLLPIPPISEQKRIVENIDKCFDLADHIDQEDSLTDKFNVNMRKSLLQSAMMGKLTKQLPEDGDASELLEQIKAEKEALVKAKKIKSQKALQIAADEIPFEIPDNWRWVRLSEISNIVMGQSPKSKDVSEGLPDNSHFEFHQGKSFFSEKTIGISNKVTISQLRLINKNYILMSVRAPVGDVNLTNRIIALGRGLCGIRPICVNKYYLYYYLMTQKNYLMRKSTGSTFKAINKKTIFEELVPLPPLSEQTRIVNKLDKLLDELKGN